MPDTHHRIAPCRPRSPVLGFGRTPGSDRGVARMPCGILRRGHAGSVYPAEKFFGKPQLPAAQPDVDVGKQGDAADIPRPGRGGQPVKAVDVISRRIELVGHVILRHGEQAPRRSPALRARATSGADCRSAPAATAGNDPCGKVPHPAVPAPLRSGASISGAAYILRGKCTPEAPTGSRIGREGFAASWFRVLCQTKIRQKPFNTNFPGIIRPSRHG